MTGAAALLTGDSRPRPKAPPRGCAWSPALVGLRVVPAVDQATRNLFSADDRRREVNELRFRAEIKKQQWPPRDAATVWASREFDARVTAAAAAYIADGGSIESVRCALVDWLRVFRPLSEAKR
jgi:hypothetical protein